MKKLSDAEVLDAMSTAELVDQINLKIARGIEDKFYQIATVELQRRLAVKRAEEAAKAAQEPK